MNARIPGLALLVLLGVASVALAQGKQMPDAGQEHIAPDQKGVYRSYPPTSGQHWGDTWADWTMYDHPLPPEEFVHNLEHGGIVLLYNCPAPCDGGTCSGGCDADVQKLIAIRAGRKPDQFNEVRVLITPDSLMPHKLAAIAWGWRWQGEAVDAAEINCFIDARYDKAPESIP